MRLPELILNCVSVVPVHFLPLSKVLNSVGLADGTDRVRGASDAIRFFIINSFREKFHFLKIRKARLPYHKPRPSSPSWCSLLEAPGCPIAFSWQIFF